MKDAAGEPRYQICIAGGGPAGMMLGLLLARSGIRAKVLEKNSDFFRDFRGDTIHPSTFEILDELGILDRFLQPPPPEEPHPDGPNWRRPPPLCTLSHP